MVEQIYKISSYLEFPLVGFVKKFTQMKTAIVVKLIDLNNMIDQFTVFINFTNEES